MVALGCASSDYDKSVLYDRDLSMKCFFCWNITSSHVKNMGELILLVTCHRFVQFQRVVISQCWAQKEAE